MSADGVIPPPEERQRRGEISHMEGANIRVHADYDTVVAGIYRFSQDQAEAFAQAFVSACWEAGANAQAMAQEGTMPP